MKFRVLFTTEAKEQLAELESRPALAIRFKAVLKCLVLIENNIRHPGLQTHKYDGLEAPNGQDMFEAYAQNRTPGAYRVFWHYGPGKGQITIFPSPRTLENNRATY